MHELSDDRRHVVDCEQQVFQQSFDHVDNLRVLRILCIKYETVGFIRYIEDFLQIYSICFIIIIFQVL